MQWNAIWRGARRSRIAICVERGQVHQRRRTRGENSIVQNIKSEKPQRGSESRCASAL
jgi:hypothetical protein